MNKFRYTFAALIISLTGCSLSIPSFFSESDNSTNNTATKDLGEHAIDGVLISFNRSTLGKTEYEQYRLAGSTLIWECGRISAGRYNPQQQSIKVASPAQVAKILDLGGEVHRLVTEKGAVFQSPGTSPEFFDPGQYTLTLERDTTPVTVRTTFDSVAVPQANREHLLNKLTLAVRGILIEAGTLPCGKKEFYLLAKPSMR